MKRFSKFNLFPFKTALVGFSSLYFLDNYSNNKYALCQAEANTDELNLENDSELNLDEDFMQAIQDPTMTDEDRAMFRRQMKQMAIQPLPFSKFHCQFKQHLEEEKWNGMRLILEFNPNQMNKLEYNLVIDDKKFWNNYKINAMSIVPFHERSQNGAFFMGRKEGDSLGLQCHLNFGENDKLLLIASHPKNDVSQAHYVAEYSREFERINTTFKLSNMELSVAASASIYKNLFTGFEAVKHHKSNSFVYNYGICLKPSSVNKYAAALTWMSVYPALNLDLMYQINKKWSVYAVFSKNWHPMATMSGHSTEMKMTHVYSEKNVYDCHLEVDYTCNIHTFNTYYLTKNLGLQFNFEFNPLAVRGEGAKKVFKSFGVGLKFMTNSVEEELMNTQKDMEESFEEYEYEKITSENIK